MSITFYLFQHLRFYNGIMVTCSKDRSIAVWDMVSPTEINLRRVLGKLDRLLSLSHARFFLDTKLIRYFENLILARISNHRYFDGPSTPAKLILRHLKDIRLVFLAC
jgi:hypothetical protein